MLVPANDYDTERIVAARVREFLDVGLLGTEGFGI